MLHTYVKYGWSQISKVYLGSCVQLYSLAETPQLLPLLPPHLGLYESALLVSQDRRHFFVTPWLHSTGTDSSHRQLVLFCLLYCKITMNHVESPTQVSRNVFPLTMRPFDNVSLELGVPDQCVSTQDRIQARGSCYQKTDMIRRNLSQHFLLHCKSNLAINAKAKSAKIFIYSFLQYFIELCFICRPSDSTVSEDAGVEPRTVATKAMAIRCFYHTRLELIHGMAKSHQQSARSHP